MFETAHEWPLTLDDLQLPVTAKNVWHGKKKFGELDLPGRFDVRGEGEREVGRGEALYNYFSYVPWCGRRVSLQSSGRATMIC